MMSIEKSKFPEFLKESDFLRNLADEDDDLVTIPKKVFKENDEVNNIKDFKKLLKTVNYFGIDYPDSLRDYSRDNTEEIFSYFYPKSYKIEIKDMFISLADIFDEVLETKTKIILEDIIDFFKDLEDPECLESELLMFYDFKRKDLINRKTKVIFKKYYYGLKTCIEEKYVKILSYIFNSILDNDYNFFKNIPSLYKDISLNKKINILEIECSGLHLEMHKKIKSNKKSINRSYVTLEELDTRIKINYYDELIVPGRYLKITNSIIEYYREKEEKIVDTYRYYTHITDDSNVSVFEGLSNANLLGIKSKLEEEDANVLLALFKAIVEENYYILEESHLDENKEDEEDEFKMPKTTEEWVEILRITSLDDTVVNDEKPYLLKDYLMIGYRKFKQKYITVGEMNTNMEITNKKLIL